MKTPVSKKTKPQLFLSDILPENIIPENNSLPPGLTLLHENGRKIFRKVVSHIDHWPEALKNEISQHLDLQFFPAKFDAHGNVCFADDPDLRPEFRTHFTPVHLFDYFYASWLTETPMPGKPTSTTVIPLPDTDFFWKRALTGDLLRSIHLASGFQKVLYALLPKDDDSTAVKFDIDKIRFVPKSPGEKGRFYLNELFYFDDVPARAIHFSLHGYFPVSEWFLIHDQEFMAPDLLTGISALIAKLNETALLRDDAKKD